MASRIVTSNQRSNLAIVCTVYATAIWICTAIFDPEATIFQLIAMALIFVVAVIILGEMHPTAMPNDDKEVVWGMAGLAVFFGCIWAPFLLFTPIFLLLPDGDSWIRGFLVVVSFGVSLWWFQFAKNNVPRLFRGKLSDKTVNAYLDSSSSNEQASMMEAALKNRGLLLNLLFAVFMILILYTDLSWPDWPHTWGRRRGMPVGVANMFDWLRGNPITGITSFAMIGLGAITLFVSRVRSAIR